MPIVFQPVQSSMLEAVAYDRERSAMIARFKGGREYFIPEVTRQRYSALLKSPSKGKYFNRHMKSRGETPLQQPSIQEKTAVSTRNLKRMHEAVQRSGRQVDSEDLTNMTPHVHVPWQIMRMKRKGITKAQHSSLWDSLRAQYGKPIREKRNIFFEENQDHPVAKRLRMKELGVESPAAYSSGHPQYLFRGVRDPSSFRRELEAKGDWGDAWLSGHAEAGATYANEGKARLLVFARDRFPTQPAMTPHIAVGKHHPDYMTLLRKARRVGRTGYGSGILGHSREFETVVTPQQALDALVGEVHPTKGLIPRTPRSFMKEMKGAKEHQHAEDTLLGRIYDDD